MKNKIINFRFFGLFLVVAALALGVNACSKKKGSNNTNPYGYGYGPNGQPIYGAPGGSNLAYGGGYAPDGSSIELAFSGQNGGQVYVTGYLDISPQAYYSGCGIAPGLYQVQSSQAIFSNGDFQVTLTAQNGMPITAYGWFNNDYLPMPSGQQATRMYVVANIPGCPTNFN